QTSTGPSASSISTAAFSTASASATSAATACARCPRSSSSCRAALSRSRPRAISPIDAPSRPNARTVARPTPADAPVTTTTEPTQGRFHARGNRKLTDGDGEDLALVEAHESFLVGPDLVDVHVV